MSVGTYEWQSDFARKYVGIGREEGREEGRAYEAARSVITILESRGLTLTPHTQRRIETCTDLHTLEQWIPKAIEADTPEDLFT
ncbi:hypothetical protein [Nocardiopsis alba]|uniref:hypothetical protein n=1 Tax=Nocardiopsis alba TaxID=53437 RepID=UPI000364469B|nr:hypothetical protein [Nocardiopsis alba]